MRFVAGIVATSVAVLGASAVTAQSRLSIGGSSTVRPLVQQAVKVFRKQHAETRVVVGGGGSGTGIAKAASGELDIGMASRALKQKEHKAHPDLQAHQIGTDGIAIVVHASNPVSNLTVEQVQKIYSGAITSWSDLGGSGDIVTVSANENHGTSAVFCKYFGLEMKRMVDGKHSELGIRVKGSSAEPHVVVSKDGNRQTIAALSTKQNAIGFVSIGVADQVIKKGAKLRMVSLEGVEPNPANVKSGKYALQRPLLLLTKGDPKGAAADFIAYMMSPNGQKLVQGMDFLPAAPAAPAK